MLCFMVCMVSEELYCLPGEPQASTHQHPPFSSLVVAQQELAAPLGRAVRWAETPLSAKTPRCEGRHAVLPQVLYALRWVGVVEAMTVTGTASGSMVCREDGREVG